MAEAMTIRRHPRNEADPNLNWDTQRITAIGAVVYTLVTTIVAPVSPRDLAKAKTTPEKIAGIDNGNTIFLKVVKEEAPKVLEACSNTGSKSSILALRVVTT